MILLLALGASRTARAGDPAFAYAADKDRDELAKVKAVEWKASAQGGLLLTAGNASLTALSAGATASRKTGQNKLQLDGGLAFARTSAFIAADVNGNGTIEQNEITRPSTTSSRQIAGKLRYDRFLTGTDALYAAALAAADQPAGKDFVGGGQLGYSRQVFHDAVHLVTAEVGYDYSYENPTVGAGASIHSARLFAGYTGKLSDDTGVELSVETLLNINSYRNATGSIDAFQDTRVNPKVSLTTALSSKLSFRFAFEARYDNAPSPRPPFALPYAMGFVPLADALDSKAEASVIVNFL